MNTLAIVNRSAPFAGQVGQESVDLVLAAASFGQQVSVFFIDDGVFQLVKQSPSEIEQKPFSKTFGAFEFYDVDKVYVCSDSLERRGLSDTELIVDVQRIDPTTLNSLLNQHHTVLSLT